MNSLNRFICLNIKESKSTLNFSSGVGAMAFSSRMFFLALLGLFCLVKSSSTWPLFFILLSSILVVKFFESKLDNYYLLYLSQYFLDALLCILSIFVIETNVFLLLLCLFIIFSRYQGGKSLGFLITSFSIVIFLVGSFVAFDGELNDASTYFLVPLLFMGFSLHLGSLLSNLYLEKNSTIESLEIRMKNKDRLLSTLAHEIRTPLTMVLSSSDILIEEIKPDINETHFDFLSTIHDSALRLVVIVEDILAQIKAEKALLKINVGPLDVRHLVKQVVNNMKPILSIKEQSIRCSYPKILTPAHGDEKWLHQALVNLVHNASKYIGFEGNILINIKENEQYFVISVTDDGLGIEDINKMDIFSGSVVDDNYRSYEGGAGIGLSIVKHIVEQHGGKLYVGTVPGVGTTLSFTLPK